MTDKERAILLLKAGAVFIGTVSLCMLAFRLAGII